MALDEDPSFIKPMANRADAYLEINKTEEALSGIKKIFSTKIRHESC
jgi:hypothetical protein